MTLTIDLWPTDPKINRDLWSMDHDQLKTLITVSLSLTCFKFNLLSRQGFYASGHCDLDIWPINPKIYRDYLWVMATKTPIIVLILIDFKHIEQTRILCYETLTFDLLTPTSIEIIYGSWPSMILIKFRLGEISLTLMSGQDLANARRTDSICHNIIRQKVLLGV